MFYYIQQTHGLCLIMLCKQIKATLLILSYNSLVTRKAVHLTASK